MISRGLLVRPAMQIDRFRCAHAQRHVLNGQYLHITQTNKKSIYSVTIYSVTIRLQLKYKIPNTLSRPLVPEMFGL